MIRRRIRALAAVALLVVVLAGCGSDDSGASSAPPFTLPVGTTTWDTTAPAWFSDGKLHVGDQTLDLGAKVDQFVLGSTGVYWMRGTTLMFTDVDNDTRKVADVGWRNLAVSADRSVLATVDQSRGPTDKYGTHVMQVAAFDTRTGEQLYRTPDKVPDSGDDLADLYGEVMPLLQGVSNTQLFFDGETIDLADGSTTRAGTDAQGIEEYAGYAETLFPDGYRVGLEGDGKMRTVEESSAFAVGLLSPDRSTVFDVGQWPTEAVVYDAKTGQQAELSTRWGHFTLAGWQDDSRFFGVAELIDEDNVENILRARQVVSCTTTTLECEPVSPVIRTKDADDNQYPSFLTEGSADQL